MRPKDDGKRVAMTVCVMDRQRRALKLQATLEGTQGSKLISRWIDENCADGFKILDSQSLSGESDATGMPADE